MGILETIGSIAGFITDFLPSIRGRTQHMSWVDADRFAKQYAEQVYYKCVRAYSSPIVNTNLAEKYRLKLISFIPTSGLWTSTQDTANILAILKFQRPETQGVNQLNHKSVGEAEYFLAVVYFHAMWILVNMDIENDTEFSRAMKSQTENLILYPAIRELNLLPETLDKVSGNPPTPIEEIQTRFAGVSPVIWIVIIGLIVTLFWKKVF